jgi:hypothetical protein
MNYRIRGFREHRELSKMKWIEKILSPQGLEVKNSMIWYVTQVPLNEL